MPAAYLVVESGVCWLWSAPLQLWRPPWWPTCWSAPPRSCSCSPGRPSQNPATTPSPGFLVSSRICQTKTRSRPQKNRSRVHTETWTQKFMTYPWLLIWFHDLENWEQVKWTNCFGQRFWCYVKKFKILIILIKWDKYKYSGKYNHALIGSAAARLFSSDIPLVAKAPNFLNKNNGDWMLNADFLNLCHLFSTH